MLRFFCLLLWALAIYLCWVPSFSSLKQSTGRVSYAGQTLTRFNADYTLDNGVLLKCTGKGWWIFGSQICPAIELKKAYETREPIIIYYSGQKVWGVESVKDKTKLVNYNSIRNSRWVVMGLISLIFMGIIVFAPILVSPRRNY